MNINLSAAELGAIVHAMQSIYQSSSDENALADSLINQVQAYFDSCLCPGLFEDWLSEFDIIV